MRAARLALGALGVAGIVWGAWLLSDDGFDRLMSTALWLAGVVVLHDFVLAPLVVALGVLAVKVLPHHRAFAAVAFLVWGGLTLAVANVLSGVGGKPDMDSLLNRPYVSAWLVLTGLIVVGAVVTAALRALPRGARAPHP
jgi:uncharacterized membrane protein YidH (DUF202 family)